ncbi:hypothetical protein [Haloarcula marina]|uniref:hypothetical protein n=1 Tax=Haloarcula marina TaxID=2961574 RepID=UPI0020B8991A|nr:hypothetical protein [Halomicroarcula marina]
MSGRFLSVDSVRLSDLSLLGWGGVWLSVAGISYTVREVVLASVWGGPWIEPIVIGGLIALLGGIGAYENARPECQSTCDHCGEIVRSHSSRDATDEFVEVHASGTPRRARLGPLSLVVERQQSTFVYCSGECATADAESRVFIESIGHDTGITAEVADD